MMGMRRGLALTAAATLLIVVCACGAAAADTGAPHAVVPAGAPHGDASPFKFAQSTAHGILRRASTGGSALASPLSSPLAQTCSASCAEPVLYHGGPVMHKEKLYVIEWQPSEPSKNGQTGTTFEPLPANYAEEVGTYLKDVAADSGKLTNVYSVDDLYGEPNASRPGEYNSTFGGEFLDTKPYPARSATYCPTGEGLPPAGEPCIADAEGDLQLGSEVARFVEEEHLPTGLEAIYFVLTPHEVNSCAGFEEGVAACNSNSYCAYHSAVSFKSKEIVYANMPYDDVEGCQTPDQPHESPADDEIDTLSHENNEAITDPLGDAWLDYDGNEIADKCTYPFFDPLSDFDPEEDDYGPLIGGTRTAAYETVEVEDVKYEVLKEPGNSYNESIDGGHFLLQREWSNAAGGCVQRAPAVNASFAIAQTSETELAFNGGTSTTEAGAITEYKWEFSNEAGSRTGEEVSQTFAVPGKYKVKLTAANNSGAVGVSEQEVTLKAGSGGLVTSTTTTTSTTTEPAVTTTRTNSVTTTISAAPLVTTSTVTDSEAQARQYVASEIAKLLGLPGNGAKLSGAGEISFGHATCPPACGVYAHLAALVREGKRTKRIQIGSLQEVVTSKGSRSISLRLTEKGEQLLRARHTLAAVLDLTVEDADGASWPIERKLTLTDGGKAARYRSHAADWARR